MGFAFGFLVMFSATRVLLVNSHDFDIMKRGVRSLISGVNPWLGVAGDLNYYNPPHAVLFLWPMLFLSPQVFLALGSGCLFAFAFYHRAWVALAWFATHTSLWLIAAGGVDMFIIGAGLLFLLAGDAASSSKRGLVLRVIAYGLLMVKPQGGFFIVLLFFLTRLDWKGALLSIIIYGVLFIPLYPSWTAVILNNPPLSQSEATHTLWARYGLPLALLVALGTVVARKWHYWQLGGALGGILTPYGVPGLPSFLTLAAVTSMKAIPIVVIWSALLAVVTWVTPPAGIDFYDYLQPFMAIYHLGMFGLVLALACISPDAEGEHLIAISDWFRRAQSNHLTD